MMTLDTFKPEQLPGFHFIDHLAIAVLQGTLQAQVDAYSKMGFQEVHREEVFGKDQVREVLLQIGKSQNLIQLLEPLNDSSPVQKMIDRQGGKGGLAHVGLRVSNARRAYNYLVENGFRLTDPAPRPGSRGTTVFFIHPKSREDQHFGVLYEIVEDPKDNLKHE
jgi:methylmalonyl-CoA/ethylmalonyl-CoA epimerase